MTETTESGGVNYRFHTICATLPPALRTAQLEADARPVDVVFVAPIDAAIDPEVARLMVNRALWNKAEQGLPARTNEQIQTVSNAVFARILPYYDYELNTDNEARKDAWLREATHQIGLTLHQIGLLQNKAPIMAHIGVGLIERFAHEGHAAIEEFRQQAVEPFFKSGQIVTPDPNTLSGSLNLTERREKQKNTEKSTPAADKNREFGPNS